MQSATRLRIGPLLANAKRRLLLHHLPVAAASTVLLALFMTLPAFDVNAYRHGDIVTGAFPKAGDDSARTVGTSARAEPIAPGRSHAGLAAPGETEAHRVRDHGSAPHASVSRNRHGHDDAVTPAQAGARLPRDDHSGAALSRTVQQLTIATGYLATVVLAVTLLLGPANLLLRRRNPVSTYLRRDVGIWAAIFSAIHVAAAVLIHVSHGSGPIATVLHFFVDQQGRALANSFGLGNWTGLAALVIAVGLLATSSDAALRTLKARRWKAIQRLTYALFGLVVLHAFFYGALLRMTSPFTLLLVVSVATVVLGQFVGVWLWRRRHVVPGSV